MSKGSLFWAKSSGKLGEIVLSQLKGQQIARAYQPQVANPKSTAQTNQRIVFANAVKFYKHATQALFKFAYEDKKKNESDYNAFMRNNAKVAAYVTRESYNNINYPAIGNQFLLSNGTLPELPFAYENKYFSMSLGSQTIADAATMTVAQLSSIMMDRFGMLEGDILTFVVVSNPAVSEITDEPSVQSSWYINQLILSSTNTETIDATFKAQNNEGFGASSTWGIRGNSGEEQFLGTIEEDTEDQLVACAIIHSRVVTGQQLRVSPAYLINGKVAKDIYQASLQSAYKNSALNSWGRQTDAILQGGIAKNV